jgi:hypothetical protein
VTNERPGSGCSGRCKPKRTAGPTGPGSVNPGIGLPNGIETNLFGIVLESSGPPIHWQGVHLLIVLHGGRGVFGAVSAWTQWMKKFAP